MASLFVTGGAGFIGSNFVHHWLRECPADRVLVFDALTYAGNAANLDSVRELPQFTFVHGNICDTALVEEMLRRHEIDTVVHFAAESHVDRSITGPDAFIETNVVGTHSLLKAVRKVWLQEQSSASHRFHHVSTDEVYGSLGPSELPFSEATAYAPNSPYSASKAGSDFLVRAYRHTYGLNTTISNCSNNYGPYHFPEKLIPLMIVNVLEGMPLPIYGDGKNVRDWLHVHDHCRGIQRVLRAGKAGEVYNLGGRSEVANVDLVRRLCAIADELLSRDHDIARRFPNSPAASGGRSENLIRFVKDRPGHDRRYAIDCSKAERELGFAPQVQLEAGLRATILWYVANAGWWRDLISGRPK